MSESSTAKGALRRPGHAIVVGGGVIGVCSAYYLAKRGLRVTVLERDEVGKGASYGNAGVIAPGHAPVNKPGRVKQALRSLLDPLSPLYVAPRFNPELASWLWAFSRACTGEQVESSMRNLAPLGHASRRLFDELQEEEKLDCDYRRGGYHEACLTARGFASAQQEAIHAREQGFRPEIFSGDELRVREPALNRDVVGGVFYPEAATINPYRFVLEMADRARRLGVVFRTGTEAAGVWETGDELRGVRTAAGEMISGDAVILAPGAYGKRLIERLGLQFPLQAAKGYHRDCRPEEGKIPALRTACVLGEKSVFCTPMDGFVRFAGTLEFSGVNHDIRQPRLDQMTNAARLYLNGVGRVEPLSEWCGLRPCMPDGLPVVGPVPGRAGVFIATGHAMLGMTLGPVTGQLTAAWVVDGRPDMELRAFRPERFTRSSEPYR